MTADVVSRLVDGVEVFALLDVRGPFFEPVRAAFTGATEADWDDAQRIDPDAFASDGTWTLAFRAFVVRGPGLRTTLIDAGVGPEGGPAASWAPGPGHLLERFDDIDLDPADIEDVVLTHLHSDHYGWSIDRTGAPTFVNAQYVLQRREVEHLTIDDAAIGHVIEPLRAAGQLQLLDGPVRLGRSRSGVALGVILTPGHTPGHHSVTVEGRHERIVIAGDVIVHAVQLVNPDVTYRFEAEPSVAARTRRSVVRRDNTRRLLLASAHLTAPFLELSSPDDR